VPKRLQETEFKFSYPLLAEALAHEFATKR